MTNFQPRPSLPLGLTSERLLVLAPALAGGLVGVLLLAAVVVPLLRGVLQRQEQLQQLRQQEAELPQNLRLSARARLDLDTAERQQQRLLQLVAGTGQLDTLLAQLGADKMAQGAPLRRLGDDEDLKGLVVLYASDAGKHITGQWIAVDGGVSAIIGG